jgi:hypothetical protein
MYNEWKEITSVGWVLGLKGNNWGFRFRVIRLCTHIIFSIEECAICTWN